MLPFVVAPAAVSTAATPTMSPPPQLSAASQHPQAHNNNNNLFSSLQLYNISQTGLSLSKHFAGVVSKTTVKDILLPTDALLQNPPDSESGAVDYAKYLTMMELYSQRKKRAAATNSSEDIGDPPTLPPTGLYLWDYLSEDQFAELVLAGFEFEEIVCGVGGAEWKGILSYGDRKGSPINAEIRRSNPGPRTRLLAHYRDYFATCQDSPGFGIWKPYNPKPAPSKRAIHRRSAPRASSSPASSHRHSSSPSPTPVTVTRTRAASAAVFFKRTAFALWDGLVGGTQSSSEPSEHSSDNDNEDIDSLDRYSSISRSRTPMTPIQQDIATTPVTAGAAAQVKSANKTPKNQLLPRELEHSYAANIVDPLCEIPLYSSVARLAWDHPRVKKYYAQQGNLIGVAARELKHIDNDNYYFDYTRPILARRIRCVAIPTHNCINGTVGPSIRRRADAEEADNDREGQAEEVTEESTENAIHYTPSIFITLSTTIRPETDPVGDGVYSDPAFPSDAPSGICFGRRDRFSLTFDPSVVSSEISDATISFYKVVPKPPTHPDETLVAAASAGATGSTTWLDKVVAAGDAKPLPLVPVVRSSASRWPERHTKHIRLYPGDVFARCTTQCVYDPSKAVSHFGGAFTIPFKDIWSASQGTVSTHDGGGLKSTMDLQLKSLSGIRSAVYERNPLHVLFKGRDLGDDAVDDDGTSCCVSLQFAFDPILPMLSNPDMDRACTSALHKISDICENLPHCPLLDELERQGKHLGAIYFGHLGPTALLTLMHQYPTPLLAILRREQIATLKAAVAHTRQLLRATDGLDTTALINLAPSQLHIDDQIFTAGLRSRASLLTLYGYFVSNSICGGSPTAADASSDGVTTTTAATTRQMNAVSAHIHTHSVGFASIGSLLNMVDDGTAERDFLAELSVPTTSAHGPSTTGSSVNLFPSSDCEVPSSQPVSHAAVAEGEVDARASVRIALDSHVTPGHHPTTTISHSHYEGIGNGDAFPVERCVIASSSRASSSLSSSLSQPRHRSVQPGRAESTSSQLHDDDIGAVVVSGGVAEAAPLSVASGDIADENESSLAMSMSSRGLPTPTPTPPAAPAPAPTSTTSTTKASTSSAANDGGSILWGRNTGVALGGGGGEVAGVSTTSPSATTTTPMITSTAITGGGAGASTTSPSTVWGMHVVGGFATLSPQRLSEMRRNYGGWSGSTVPSASSPSLPMVATATLMTEAMAAASSSTTTTTPTRPTSAFVAAAAANPAIATTDTTTTARATTTATTTSATSVAAIVVVPSVIASDTTTPQRSHRHGSGTPHTLAPSERTATYLAHTQERVQTPGVDDDSVTAEPATSAKPSQPSQVTPSQFDSKHSSSSRKPLRGELSFETASVIVGVVRSSGAAASSSAAAASSSAPHVERSTVVRELNFTDCEEEGTAEKPKPVTRTVVEVPPVRPVVVAPTRRSKTIEAALFLLDDVDDEDTTTTTTTTANRPSRVSPTTTTEVGTTRINASDTLLSRFRPRTSTEVSSSSAASSPQHLTSYRVTPTTTNGRDVHVTSAATTPTSHTNSFLVISPSSTIQGSSVRHAPAHTNSKTTTTAQGSSGTRPSAAISVVSASSVAAPRSGGDRGGGGNGGSSRKSTREVCKELDDDINNLLNRSSLRRSGGGAAGTTTTITSAGGVSSPHHRFSSANSPSSSSNNRPTPSKMHIAIQEGAARFAALKLTPPSDPRNTNSNATEVVPPTLTRPSSGTRQPAHFERPPTTTTSMGIVGGGAAVRGAGHTGQQRLVPNTTSTASTNVRSTAQSMLDRPRTFNARVNDYVSDQARHAVLRGQQQRPPSPSFDGGVDNYDDGMYGDDDDGPSAQRGRRVDYSHPAVFTPIQPASPLQAPHGRPPQLPRGATTTTTATARTNAPTSHHPLLLPKGGDKAALRASIDTYQRATRGGEAPATATTTTTTSTVPPPHHRQVDRADPLTAPCNSGLQHAGSYQMGGGHGRSVRRVLCTGGRPSDEDVAHDGGDDDDARSCDIPSFVPDTRHCKRGSTYRTPVASNTSTPYHGRTNGRTNAPTAAAQAVPAPRSALRSSSAANPAWSRHSSPTDTHAAATSSSKGVPPTTARKHAPPAPTPKKAVAQAIDDDDDDYDFAGHIDDDADRKKKQSESARASAFRLFLERDGYCREGEYELAARLASRPSLRAHRVSRAGGLTQADALLRSPMSPINLSPPNHPMFAGVKRGRSNRPHQQQHSRYGLRYFDVTPEVDEAPHPHHPHPQHQQYSYPPSAYPPRQPQPLQHSYSHHQPPQPYYYNTNQYQQPPMVYGAPPQHMYPNYMYQGVGIMHPPPPPPMAAAPYHPGAYYPPPPHQQYGW